MTETQASQPQLRSADVWLTAGRFALLLGCLVFIAFPGVLMGFETFVSRDFGVYGYPLAYFQRQCFWRGELPFWNPFNFCGVPFLAQWNTMSLYPLSLIYLLLPLTWALNFFCLLHLWFGGVGMYFLSNHWTGNRLAAAVAGIVFAFNGMSQNLLMGPSLIAGLAWMPWVVLTVESAWRAGGSKLLLAGLVGTLQMLTGTPEIILLTWMVLTALWITECFWFSNGFRGGNRNPSMSVESDRCAVRPSVLVLRFLVVVLVVATLSAVQLVPFLDLLAHAQRSGEFADTRWPMPLSGWANFFVPMAFGSTPDEGVFFQHGQYWTSSYYLGIGTLALALFAVLSGPTRRPWVLAVAACVSVFLALGAQTVIYRWLARLIPPLAVMNFPVKFLIVTTFAGPLLAGFGVAHWRSALSTPQSKRLLWVSGWVMFLLVAILLWCWRLALPSGEFVATIRNGIVRALFLVLTIVTLLLLRRSTKVPVQRFLSCLLMLLIWIDLRTHEPNQNPTVAPGVYEPGMVRSNTTWNPPPGLAVSRVMVSRLARYGFGGLNTPDAKDNYLARRLGFCANCNLLDEIPKVDGFFPLCPRELFLIHSLLYASEKEDFPRLRDFLSVSQVTAPREFNEWSARPTFLPMVTAGQKPVFLEENEIRRQFVEDSFDAAKTVLLEPEARSFLSVSNQTAARVVSSRMSTRELQAQVESSESSVVVVSQTYYHWWRAYVDGSPAPLLRANFAFQAVPVPAGKHLIRLAYEDRGFRAGAAISVVALLTCLGVWAYSRRKGVFS
jgi:hypothetical protein